MKLLKGFGQFWYDFIIGDDWKIAAAVLAAILVTFGGWKADLFPTTAVPVIGAILLFAFFATSVTIDQRRR
jgi:putative Ca2+/H+ antiporter (TMEM165/GDT1 family)